MSNYSTIVDSAGRKASRLDWSCEGDFPLVSRPLFVPAIRLQDALEGTPGMARVGGDARRAATGGRGNEQAKEMGPYQASLPTRTTMEKSMDIDFLQSPHQLSESKIVGVLKVDRYQPTPAGRCCGGPASVLFQGMDKDREGENADQS